MDNLDALFQQLDEFAAGCNTQSQNLYKELRCLAEQQELSLRKRLRAVRSIEELASFAQSRQVSTNCYTGYSVHLRNLLGCLEHL